jgi:threonine dehydrogenase-like Zn-dependent dehydrogenase
VGAVTPATARASVALSGGGTSVRRLPVPDPGPDGGWLRVQASGICGTDVDLYRAGLAAPTVLGHHVHGEVVALGEAAASRWGRSVGDRVVVEEYLPCGRCPSCLAGRYRLCPRTDMWGEGRRVGLVPVDEAPGLWGGNAELMYLPAEAVLHPLPATLDDALAAWVLPFANALDWVLGAGALQPGERLVVLGPGHHGLAAVAAARYGGAGEVVVCGLASDRSRLELAAALGAATLQSHGRDWPERLAALTGGPLADVVLDVTGVQAGSVPAGLALLAPGGRLLLAGGRRSATTALDTSELTRLTATVRGVRGRAPERVRQSIDLLAAGVGGLDHVPTEDLPLDEVGPMLERLARGTGPATPHVVVRPWLDGDAR